MELISVVIPTYNRSNMIENAIRSVLSQTYDNIELIVVDDNADNNIERKKTSEIISKYDNIKYICNDKNLGGALTRNVGILNSNGKYVAFLDDDDIFLPNKIELQYKLIKEKEKLGLNVAMVYCYKNTFDKDGNISKSKKINVEGNCLLEHMLNIMETTSTWLCSKQALISVGMFENVKAHQDNILLLKLLASDYHIYRVPEYLVNFYLHNGDGITRVNKSYIEKTNVLFEYKRKYYNLLTKEEIEKVEYVNSSMLIRLYRINNMFDEYITEMKKVFKNNKFRLHTLKMMLFIFYIKRR